MKAAFGLTVAALLLVARAPADDVPRPQDTACYLLSDDEVHANFRPDAGAGTGLSYDYGIDCEWKSGSDSLLLSVIFDPKLKGMGDTPEAAYDAALARAKSSKYLEVTELNGYGDRAFIYSESVTGISVFFGIKGKLIVAMLFNHTKPDGVMPLAKLVTERL